MFTPAETQEAKAFASGAALSAAIHGVLFLLVLFGHRLGHRIEAPPELPVIMADLLRLGEVMPEPGQLPELHNPPPAPVAQERSVAARPTPAPTPTPAPPDPDTVVLQREPTPTPPTREPTPPTPPRTPQPTTQAGGGEAQRAAAVGRHDPSREITDGPALGSPDGFAGGVSLSDSAMRNQFSRIQAQFNEAFQRPSNLTDDQLRNLRVILFVRVTEQGRIASFEIVRSSGNSAFDFRARQMANRFREGDLRLDLPSVTNESLRRDLIRRGFLVSIPE